MLSTFVAVFVSLGLYSYTRTSATWDEPIHLTAGYAALSRGDYRIDPSHPPLLRLWASLPLLIMPGVSKLEEPAAGAPAEWLSEAYRYSHRFLYQQNDADRLLYAARFMVLLLGALLGVMIFFWGRAWLGLWGGIAALVCYTLEPNLLAHSTLVTTDLGVACFMFGACFFAWRSSQAFTPANVIGLIGFVSLAVTSKFSALLLAPGLIVLLALSVLSGAIAFRRAAWLVAVVTMTSLGAIWASYGFRYAPSAVPDWKFDFHASNMSAAAPALATLVGWIDDHHLLPNAFTEGAFYAGTSLQPMPAYLAGAISTEGWWYYFPFALLIKTPLALLVLAAVGLWPVMWRRGQPLSPAPFVLVPAAIYFGVAMASGVNIGIRHILPVYPPLVLVAAAGALQLRRLPGRVAPLAVAFAGIALVAETASVYPSQLAFFNRLVGGPDNGHEYLLDSNLAWGQSLKPLKAWMTEAGVEHVNLAYFGQADPSYYGIDCTHLPGAPSFALESIARPKLPGYVAISETTLHGVYSPPQWRLFYAGFRDVVPVAVIDHAIRVYWVEEWPEGSIEPDGGAMAHRALGDALLFGLQWPLHAERHYRQYLTTAPRDAEAFTNYGLALMATGRIHQGVDALHTAVAADGDNGRARLMLARALFENEDRAGALPHAERAVALRPGDPEALLLLGRLYASQHTFDRAASAFQAALALRPGDREAQQLLRRLDAEGWRGGKARAR